MFCLLFTGYFGREAGGLDEVDSLTFGANLFDIEIFFFSLRKTPLSVSVPIFYLMNVCTD
jgi:hypothetical protein